MASPLLLSESHRLEIAPESLSRKRFHSLPVDLPPGGAELQVEMHYDGDARIDLGVLDPRSADGSLRGFRGWSGSSRGSFTIQRLAATPGYLPGPISAGRWQIIIGLYVVSEAIQVFVEVRVRRRRSIDAPELTERTSAGAYATGVAALDLDDAALLSISREQVREIPGIPRVTPENPLIEEGWLRADLHCHTNHSNDAERPMTVPDAVAAGEAVGLDCLAITEHNTVSHWPALRRIEKETDLILIRAQEVTTYSGHFNAFGARGIVDFRYVDDPALVEAASRAAKEGALLSVNHPKSLGPSWDYKIPECFSAVEVWQAPWPWANWQSIAFWDAALTSGRQLAAVGGSDVHDLYVRPFHQLGTPTTWIRATKRSVDGALSAIRRGETLVSSTPTSPLVMTERHTAAGAWRSAPGYAVRPGTQLRARTIGDCRGKALRVVSARGTREIHYLSGTDEVVKLGPVEGSDLWIRTELWGDGIFTTGPVSGRVSQMSALAGPVYVDEK